MNINAVILKIGEEETCPYTMPQLWDAYSAMTSKTIVRIPNKCEAWLIAELNKKLKTPQDEEAQSNGELK